MAGDGPQIPDVESQISAMMDEALTPFERRAALDRLLHDANAQRCFGRYCLIRDTLQDHLPQTLDLHFADRLQKAIDAEPPLHRRPSWRNPMIRFALAASVMVVSVMALKLAPIAPTPPAPTLSQTAPRPATVLPTPLPLAHPPTNTALALNARLDDYWVNHMGRSSPHHLQGMLPYARLVGYQSDLER